MAKQLGRGGWQRWSVNEARAALTELAQSGESAAAFARRKGVSTQRVNYWKKRFGKTRTPAFVAVSLPVAITGRSHMIEIAVSHIIVRVREDSDPEDLARLVEALARRTRVC